MVVYKSILYEKGVHIISVDTDEDRIALKNELLKDCPEYNIGIKQRFLPKKIGPFTTEVKNTVYDILMSDNAIKHKGEDYIMKHLAALGCDNLIHRRPKTLSQGQMKKHKTNISKKKRCIEKMHLFSIYDRSLYNERIIVMASDSLVCFFTL